MEAVAVPLMASHTSELLPEAPHPEATGPSLGEPGRPEAAHRPSCLLADLGEHRGRIRVVQSSPPRTPSHGTGSMRAVKPHQGRGPGGVGALPRAGASLFYPDALVRLMDGQPTVSWGPGGCQRGNEQGENQAARLGLCQDVHIQHVCMCVHTRTHTCACVRYTWEHVQVCGYEGTGAVRVGTPRKEATESRAWPPRALWQEGTPPASQPVRSRLALGLLDQEAGQRARGFTPWPA